TRAASTPLAPRVSKKIQDYLQSWSPNMGATRVNRARLRRIAKHTKRNHIGSWSCHPFFATIFR
ncbi:MAG: hypothetical protein WBP89_04040, partial [Sedimenticolaceae bacterium]